MKLSINDKIINKNETQQRSQSKGFKPFDLTPAQLADHIARGHAFSFQFADSYRKSENFLCSDIIAADIDDGMTLEEAMNDRFILDNACLLYTTASHTPEEHRFRLIFQLPHTVTDAEQMRSVLRGLVRKFPADKANTDPARQFYGSKGCSTHLFDRTMSEGAFDHLLKLGHEPIDLPDRQDVKSTKSGFRSMVSLEPGSMVRNARGVLVPLDEMEGSQPIYCPFHNDKKPSAFTTISKNGTKGVHCSSCQVTFWVGRQKPEPYDFLFFDKLVRKEVGVSSWGTDPTGVIEFEVPNPNIIVNQRHIPHFPMEDGITLIKSGKGTGKTTYLVELVKQCKAQKKSVLLIGHRRVLLQSMASKLGLEYYEDVKNTSKFSPKKISKYFAVSVDSMATMLKPNIHDFDVVLIDESEQVFSHLIADTLNPTLRRKCYLLMEYYIQRAKVVVGLDADLNQITLHAIRRPVGMSLKDRRLILNEHRSAGETVELYSNENHLIGDIFKSIKQQERIFVCSNSKKQIDALVEAIKSEFGDDFPLFFVTSENSNSDQVKEFLADIKHEILKYRVILASPAMGTGIDIAFEGELSHVEGVYGIFEARINTHFDIDQQLSRVRHPKFVRVWISPETFNFETEVDPIKHEVAECGFVPETLKGYALNGMPTYDLTDSYLILFATILAAQRASKNDLKRNFAELRTYNGWHVRHVEREEESAADGGKHAKQGEALRKQNLRQRILNAEVLAPDRVDDLIAKRQTGKSLTKPEQDSLERYFLERFYDLPASQELLEKDNEGKYQKQIEMYEQLLRNSDDDSNKSEFGLLRELFESAGIFSRSAFDTSVTITNEGLRSFVATCNKRKGKIETLLKISLRNDYASKPMQQLSLFLGICGIKTVKKNPVKKNGQKIYQYKIDAVALGEIQEIVKRRKSKRSITMSD